MESFIVICLFTMDISTAYVKDRWRGPLPHQHRSPPTHRGPRRAMDTIQQKETTYGIEIKLELSELSSGLGELVDAGEPGVLPSPLTLRCRSDFHFVTCFLIDVDGSLF